MKTKTTEFNFFRVLILAIVVVFLTFVYFMVRAGYSTRITGLKNPADIAVNRAAWGSVAGKVPGKGYLILEDSEDAVSLSLRDSVELALESLGSRYAYTQELSSGEAAGGWDGIIITRTYLPDYEIMEELFDYSRNGGLLIFAVRPETNEVFKSIYQQLGIYEHYYYKESKGFHAVPGLLSSGSFDISYAEDGEWLLNSIIELHVRDECRILAENDDGAPLIWDLDYGSGKILVMNNSLMTYKSSGGFFLSVMSHVNGPLMYPVINAKAFAIEGFPIPSDVNSDYLKKEYLRSGSSFLRELWWPSMARLSASAGIRYTAGVLTGYASEASFASGAVLSEDMDFGFYAKEIARYGGEIAFTGFNQKPLFFSNLKAGMDFDPWSSPETAGLRTGESLNWIAEILPRYRLYTFLPTERVMDDEGYEIIRGLMPELQAVCGDFTDKQRFYQNFTVDEYDIAQFPVVTSGFVMEDIDSWNLMNAVTANGVIFHSANAADVMLETDPDKNWSSISQDFLQFCESYMGDTPLDSLTVTEAALRLREMESMKVSLEYGESSIDVRIENMPQKASFMLLSPDTRPENQPGIACSEIHEGKYLVTAVLEEFTLILK